MKDAARLGREMGLVVMLEKETTERHGVKTLEHLIDGLEEIKRDDAVCFLSNYLVQRGVESMF